MIKKLLILGGYGLTGKCFAPLFLEYTIDVDIILAGRNIDKANEMANSLNLKFDGNRVSGIAIDAKDKESLKKTFVNVDMVVILSSTVEYTEQILEAALETNTDYIDIQYSNQKLKLLKDNEEKIKNAGLTFITEAGFHPGLPSFLVRYSALYFDKIEKALVSSLIKFEEATKITTIPDSFYELVEMFLEYSADTFKDNKWGSSPIDMLLPYKKFDFREYGKKFCVPMMFEELRDIPKMYPSIKETGFFMAGLNWFVDYFISPIMIFCLFLFKQKAVKPMAKLLFWSLQKFTKPPFITILKVDAEGFKNEKRKGLEVLLSHRSEYMFTAIPIVACLLQYLDGSIKKGLYMMGHIVDEKRLMEDMKKMGIKVDIIEKG